MPASGAERKAFKAIGNLTTAVTSMRFNHDSQILALASRTNKDQLKLVRRFRRRAHPTPVLTRAAFRFTGAPPFRNRLLQLAYAADPAPPCHRSGFLSGKRMARRRKCPRQSPVVLDQEFHLIQAPLVTLSLHYTTFVADLDCERVELVQSVIQSERAVWLTEEVALHTLL